MAESKNNSKVGLIFQKIPAIMAEIKNIGKTKKNEKQQYFFRGIDDVYAEIHPLFVKHKVFTVSEIISEACDQKKASSGAILMYRILKIKYTFYTSDGSSIATTVIGEGMDTGDKASNKAMAVGHKYALLQVFCIPTDDPKDPENDSPEAEDFASAMGASDDPDEGKPGSDSDPFASAAQDTPDSKTETESPREKTGKVEKTKSSKETKPPTKEEVDKEAYRTIELALSGGFKKKVSKFEALDYFKKLKGVLGELSYYAILAQHDCKSSKDVPPEKIPEVYAAMMKAFEYGKSKAEKNSPQQGGKRGSSEPIF